MGVSFVSIVEELGILIIFWGNTRVLEISALKLGGCSDMEVSFVSKTDTLGIIIGTTLFDILENILLILGYN
jgi:hypothetical protein